MLRSWRFTLWIVCAVLLVLTIPAGQCRGESRTWTGAIDDDWFDEANWDPTGGPDEFDILSILSGSPLPNVGYASAGKKGE